jgi:hypothetical protein
MIHLIDSPQLAVPEKKESPISYFSEDPRKFTQIADLLIFGIGKRQLAKMQINIKFQSFKHLLIRSL